MDGSLYHPLFLCFISISCVWMSIRYLSSPDYSLQEETNGVLWVSIISVVLSFWIGFRPISVHFGDTGAYASEYVQTEISFVAMNWQSEWIWQWLMMLCKSLGLKVSGFFTVVALGYILSALWAVKRFMPSNPMLGMLFVWASLMFFTFSTNGLRNGLACHLILLALSFLLADKYVPSIALCLTAFGIHRSTMLPIAAIVAGLFVIKDIKYALYFWVASIFISLVAGGAVTNFFTSLGFDDRMSSYATDDSYTDLFSHTGFRWDFLLYSTMPVLLVWYVAVKRNIQDNWYHVIGVTYCLCNAFWIMVIRSSFSNRFAYLSWFLYPIVIAYPLINMPIWNDQDRKTGQILLAYCSFTLFMETVVWR